MDRVCGAQRLVERAASSFFFRFVQPQLCEVHTCLPRRGSRVDEQMCGTAEDIGVAHLAFFQILLTDWAP